MWNFPSKKIWWIFHDLRYLSSFTRPISHLSQQGTAIWPGEDAPAVLLGVQKLPAEAAAALGALGGQDAVARGDAGAPPLLAG